MAEPPPKRQKLTDLTSKPSIIGFSFDIGDSVTLVVGPEKREMLVQANVLERGSGFFKAALKKEWLEGQTHRITLPDDTHQAMTDYLNFAYCSRLPSSHFLTRAACIASPLAYASLATLYVMGERLIDSRLKNGVILEWLRLLYLCGIPAGVPGMDAINIIYEGTTPGDSARRFLADMYANYSLSSWLDDDDCNSEFVLDLAKEAINRRTPHNMRTLVDIDYMV